jgi:hypothetical protein
MKKNIIYLITVCFISFVCSCGDDEKTQHTIDDTPTKETENNTTLTQDNNVIYLEGIYATSTMLPHKNNTINNVFDGNTSTNWITMKGAGPDEGFMLYFKKPEHISTIKLSQAIGNEFSEITKVTVYGNGKQLGDFDINDSILLDKKYKSLFIKIKDLKGLMVEEKESGNDFDNEYENHRITTFNNNLSVGLSKIEIYRNGELMNIQPLHQVEGEVTASSVLSPEIAYHPSLLFDSRKEMVWAEGNHGTAGVAETLNFKLKNEIVITGIEIWNGYQRSSKHFEANARVEKFEFGLTNDNGKKGSYSLLDDSKPQYIKLDEPITGKEFSLKILSAYHGKKYTDLVISEIRLYSNGVPFIIKTTFEEENSTNNIEKYKETALKKIIDKRINNIYNEDINGFSYDRSLIIRSNNTFVMYDSKFNYNESDKDTLKLVADGNWEVVEEYENETKIRVFGKYASLTDDYGFYKGKGKAAYHKIFQDFVTITNKHIEGEKFIERLEFEY